MLYDPIPGSNFKDIETPSIDRNLNLRAAELSQLPGFRIFFNKVFFSEIFTLFYVWGHNRKETEYVKNKIVQIEKKT